MSESEKDWRDYVTYYVKPDALYDAEGVYSPVERVVLDIEKIPEVGDAALRCYLEEQRDDLRSESSMLHVPFASSDGRLSHCYMVPVEPLDVPSSE